MNTKLLEVINSEKLIELGFTEEVDGSGDPRGTFYSIINDKFNLLIDAWADVTLCRVNPDTDPIVLKVDDISELENIVDWIKD